MAYGIDNFQYHGFDEVKIDQKALDPIPVMHGQTKVIGDIATVGVKIDDYEKSSPPIQGILMKNDENMNVKYDIKDVLEAPVKKGEQVGTITYSVDGEKWKVDTLIITEDIDKIDLPWCFERILQKFCLT